MRLPLLLLQLPLRPRSQRQRAASRTATPTRHRHGQGALAALRCRSRPRLPTTPRQWGGVRLSPFLRQLPLRLSLAALAASQPRGHTRPAATRLSRPRCSSQPLPPASSDDATAVAAVCGPRCCCSCRCNPHSQPQLTESEEAKPPSRRSAAAPPNDATAVAAECSSRCCCRSCHCDSHSQRQPPASRTATPTRHPRCSPLLLPPACSNDATAVAAVCGCRCCCCGCRRVLACSTSGQPAAQPRASDSEAAKPPSLLSDAGPVRTFRRRDGGSGGVRFPLLLLQLLLRPSPTAPATSQPRRHPPDSETAKPPSLLSAAASARASQRRHGGGGGVRLPLRLLQLPLRPRSQPAVVSPSDDATAVTAVCGSRCCCCSCHYDPHYTASYQPAAEAPARQRGGQAALAALRCRSRCASHDATAVATACGSRCCCCSYHCGSHIAAPATSQPHGHSHAAARAEPPSLLSAAARACVFQWRHGGGGGVQLPQLLLQLPPCHRLQRQLPASRTATPFGQRDSDAALAALRCCSRPHLPTTSQQWRQGAAAATATLTHCASHQPAAQAPARQRGGQAALAALRC